MLLSIWTAAKAAMGLKNLTGPLVWILGFIFISGGAITWLREDAINDTNAKWNLEVAKADATHKLEIGAKQIEVERLQTRLLLKEKADDDKAREDQEYLDSQKAQFPLSPECSRCRVPNERIWVRGKQSTSVERTSKPTSKPGS